MSVIDKLTPDMARYRVLDSAEAAEFWGVSLSHWRRLYRNEKVPKPMRVADRKLGWRFGSLIDALEARSKEAA